MGRLAILSCCLLVLAAGAAVGQQATGPGDTPIPSGYVDVAGRIVRIDLDRHGFALQPRGDVRPILVEVTRGTVITKNGRPATYTDLLVGDLAKCRVERVDNRWVKALTVDARTPVDDTIRVPGVITAVELERSVVAIRPVVGDPVRFTVNRGTVITKDGVVVGLGDIVPGDLGLAILQKTDLGLVALELHVRTEPQQVEGRVAAVDVEARTVTVVTADGTRPILIRVLENTLITRNGERVRLPAVQVRDYALALVIQTPAGPVAEQLHTSDIAPPVLLSGAITGVRPDAGIVRIGVRPRNSTVDVMVTADTILLRDGQPALITDLKVGDWVHAIAVRGDQGLLALCLRARTPFVKVAGMVREVNYDRGWFTMAVPGGNRVLTMRVNKWTRLVKNGQPARFAQLRPGDEATVDYLVLNEGNLALRVWARGR